MVKLSVVIPHLNYGRYLRQCLDSLAAQTVTDWEAYLVDGGSTDDTLRIIDDYPWLRVLVDIPAAGPVRAVNKALPLLRGEYFHQLNSDCWLEPDAYDLCLSVFAANPRLGMVYGGWRRVNDAGDDLGQAPQPPYFSREFLLRGNFIDASSMVIRTHVVRAVGGFDPRCPWSMDWLMAVKVAAKYPVTFIPRTLFHYRVHPGQVTEDKSAREYATAYNIVKQYYTLPQRMRARMETEARRLGRRVLR